MGNGFLRGRGGRIAGRRTPGVTAWEVAGKILGIVLVHRRGAVERRGALDLRALDPAGPRAVPGGGRAAHSRNTPNSFSARHRCVRAGPRSVPVWLRYAPARRALAGNGRAGVGTHARG